MNNKNFTHLEFLKHKLLEGECANVSEHNHNCYEITYFINGVGQTIIGNHTYNFSPNSFLVTEPYLPHTQISDYVEVLYIGFFYDGSLGKLKPDFFIEEDNIDLLFLLRLMEKILNDNGNKNTKACLLEIQKLIIYKLINLSIDDSTQKEKSLNHSDKISNAANYLKQNYYHEINFEKLATEIGYSQSYFRHYFQKVYGISPMNYLVNERINQSMVMLANTSQSIKTIALLCGFRSYANYVSIFKQHTHLTPTQYRSFINENREFANFFYEKQTPEQK